MRVTGQFILFIFLIFCVLGFVGCDDCEENCGECTDCPADDDSAAGGTDDDTADDDTSIGDDDTGGFENPQNEITELTPLLNPDGTLRARGWARAPLMQYNPQYIPDDVLIRKKEWDHYTIVTPDFAFAVTISDIRIVTFVSFEIVDFQAEKIISGVDIVLGSQGTIPLSPMENTYYENGATFMTMTYDNGVRTITSHIDPSILSVEMDCDITITQNPNDEDVATAAPFNEEGTLFFYENKIQGMPTAGQITVDGQTYIFDPEHSFAVLDWGHGVWPHTHEWHWGFAADYVNGDIAGFNIGDGWSLDNLGTANTQKYHGKMHKLYNVYFDYDPNSMMDPWRVTSDDGRLDVILEPFFHQKAGLMVIDLGMLLDKMYGYFSGKMTLDDGTVVEIEKMVGFVEHSYQKW